VKNQGGLTFLSKSRIIAVLANRVVAHFKKCEESPNTTEQGAGEIPAEATPGKVQQKKTAN